MRSNPTRDRQLRDLLDQIEAEWDRRGAEPVPGGYELLPTFPPDTHLLERTLWTAADRSRWREEVWRDRDLETARQALEQLGLPTPTTVVAEAVERKRRGGGREVDAANEGCRKVFTWLLEYEAANLTQGRPGKTLAAARQEFEGKPEYRWVPTSPKNFRRQTEVFKAYMAAHSGKP